LSLTLLFQKGGDFLEKSESIYDILKSEHVWVKQQFQQIITTRDMPLFSQTLGPLTKHMSGEETLFYPKLEANSDTKVLALKLYEAHNSGKDLVEKMKSTQADDKWLAQVELLSDMLASHIEDEETHVFPAAMKVISENEALEIGRAYKDR
jgi:hemerythrin superfamily protein